MELARRVAAVTGFSGRIVLDPGYPDGTPQKLLDVSRITALGWQARTPLDIGLHQAYDWFCRSPWAEST
jgi:GDP-L-fucose synthase